MWREAGKENVGERTEGLSTWSIYIYIYTYMFLCVCVYVYMCVCVCVCVCICMYLCIAVVQSALKTRVHWKVM